MAIDASRHDPDSLIPLVVGVTGHRSILEEGRADLERRVRETLEELHRLAAPTPLVVLSPLALGCDRIAARAAIELRRRKGGVRLLVPLPLTEEDYRADFVTSEDLAEYESLRSEADGVYALRPRKGAATVDGRIPEGPERDLHYRRLGLYIAMHSHVVLAMWNGTPPTPETVGGTGDIVRFCERGGPGLMTPEALERLDIPFRARRPLLLPDESTPLLVLATERGKGDGELAQARSREDQNDRVIHQRLRARLKPLVEINRLLGTKPRPDSDLVSERRRTRLDQVAIDRKKLFLRRAGWICLLTLAAVTCFQGASSFADTSWWLLLPYLGLLSIALFLFLKARRERLEDLFILARGTAEAMRIQRAWCSAGIDEFLVDHHPARRRRDIEDLRTLMLGATVDTPIESPGPSAWREWIDEQATYFSPEHGSTRRRRAAVARYRRIAGLGTAACLAGAIAAIAIAFTSGLGPASFAWNWAMFAIGASLAFVTLFKAFESVQLDGEELDKAVRMREVFARAGELADRSGSEQDRVAIARATGKEAMDEIVDWVVSHRDRMERPGLG